MTLGAAIQHRLNPYQRPRRLKAGGLSKPPVMPSNAHEILAEGEFNRFYIRALCLRAVDALLRDLRSHPGVETSLGLPPGPNSGLSVQLP